MIIVPWVVVLCILFLPQLLKNPLPPLSYEAFLAIGFIIVVGLPDGLRHLLSLPESQEAMLLKLFWIVVLFLHILFMVYRKLTIWIIIFLLMSISAVGCKMMMPPTSPTHLSDIK